MILESNQRELIFHVRTRSIAQVLQLEQRAESSRELSRQGGRVAVVGANQGVHHRGTEGTHKERRSVRVPFFSLLFLAGERACVMSQAPGVGDQERSGLGAALVMAGEASSEEDDRGESGRHRRHAQ